MWNGVTDSKKAKRLSKEEIKKRLLESMIIDKVVESKELNEWKGRENIRTRKSGKDN